MNWPEIDPQEKRMTEKETELWKSNPDKAIRDVGFPMEENCMSEEKKCPDCGCVQGSVGCPNQEFHQPTPASEEKKCPKCLGEGYIPGAYLEGATECECQKPTRAQEEWRIGPTVKYSENEYGAAIKRPDGFGATAWGLTEQEALQTAERIVEAVNFVGGADVRILESIHTDLETELAMSKSYVADLTQERDQLKSELAKAREEINLQYIKHGDLRETIEHYKDKNDSLTSNLTRANDEVNQLKADLEITKAEYAMLSTAYKKEQAVMERLEKADKIIAWFKEWYSIQPTLVQESEHVSQLNKEIKTWPWS